MHHYIIRRILIFIPTLLLVTLAIFFLVSLIPGDIVDVMRTKALDVEVDRATVERNLGLDAPLVVQYGRWMGILPRKDGRFKGILQGSLGESWWHRKTVNELLISRWPVTLELGLLGLIISQLVALPIGIYSALRQDRLGDYVGRSIAILAISIPGFWIATLVIVFPAMWWGYMPPIVLIRFGEDPLGNLRMFIVPAIVLGLSIGGMTMRMTRTMMLEVLRQDYIRTAWSKGITERVVVVRHALKNALIPVITIIGLQVPILVGGSVIIEQVFNLPGMGRLLVDSLMERDHPTIRGITFLFGIALVVINLLVDLSYAYLDPRVQYK